MIPSNVDFQHDVFVLLYVVLTKLSSKKFIGNNFEALQTRTVVKILPAIGTELDSGMNLRKTLQERLDVFRTAQDVVPTENRHDHSGQEKTHFL